MPAPKKYLVSTMHKSYKDGVFIVPVEILAYSAKEAAQKRLDLLSNKKDCKSLLVTLTREGGLSLGQSEVFSVKHIVVDEWVVNHG